MKKDNWRREDYKSKLIKLYDDVANVNWGVGTGSRYWGFVRKLKKQIENNQDFSNSTMQRSKVGILSANTSLIGYKYGTTGFNPELIREEKIYGLENAFEILFKSLNPQVIILTIGGNLSNGYVNNCLRIVRRPLQLDIF